jgi:FkbM family methyltransferase
MASIFDSIKNGLIAGGRLLPSQLRKSLFHFAYNCAPLEFEKFSYLYANALSQEHLLRAIALRGFSPRLVVDVGAYKGQWSALARSIWPECRIIMIEPNREERAGLEAKAAALKATLYNELLGAEEGRQVEFHVMATGSSILPERSDVSRVIETRRLSTLNSILADQEDIGLLKIDAQGYELAILSGADNVLPRVHAVLLEIALIDVNEGCPILHEVLSFMRARDFVAYDILEMHRRPSDRTLLQIDVFFCREGSKLRADKRFAP